MLKRKPGLHDQEAIERARLECGREAIGVGRDFDLLPSGLGDRLVEKARCLGPQPWIVHGVTDTELVGWSPATRRLLQRHGQRQPLAGDDFPRDGRNQSVVVRP